MRRKTIALIALAGLVVLAGCTGGETATPTLTETATPDGTGTETATEPADDGTTDDRRSGASVDAATLRSDTLTAMGNVTAYTATQNITIVQQVADVNQTVTIDAEYALNRSTRAFESHRTRTQSGRQLDVDRYLVDQTLYQRSSQFVNAHGSEWIKQDLSENMDQQWPLFDQLWRYQFFLNNASLSDVERETISGTETYVMTADVDVEEMNTALRDQLNLPTSTSAGAAGNMSVNATVWIDAETNRPVQVERSVTGTQTAQGQTVEIDREVRTQLTYEAVSVDLPDEASSAQTVNDE